MIKNILQKLLIFAEKHTNIGHRIARGIRSGRCDRSFIFQEVESNKLGMFDSFVKTAKTRGVSITSHLVSDKKFTSSLARYAEKSGLESADLASMSKEELLSFMLQKCGVGPCKFAQIISSDKSIMSKMSPDIQEIIRKTQSENMFSRTLEKAQEILNRGLCTAQTTAQQTIERASEQYTLIKQLSAGTVGEAYLAKTNEGKEVIVKMIKQGVDAEQLELEQTIFTKLLQEFSPDTQTAEKLCDTLSNLYKNWSKELNFESEYKFNKLLQRGAKRYIVADITHIAPDKSFIVMEKAEGIQMNDLMKALKAYKENPEKFREEYAEIIKANPWLENPDKVIKELPDAITKAFDEMFLFIKKDGTTLLHGDAHMGNYFITATETGSLIPVYIDTGCCIQRNAAQIKSDLQFLSNYFVGNSKGLAKYFISMTESSPKKYAPPSKLLESQFDTREQLISKLAEDIQTHIFGKRHNITDVDAVQKTIQNIMEKHGLTINPDATTAMKAQMQFYTNITEAASLSGKTINVGTMIKDIPQALLCMAKAKFNPFTIISSALKFLYYHQEQASRTITQFMVEPPKAMQFLTY